MPLHGSDKPIHRTAVPENVNVAELTSVRAALPPLLFGFVLVNQSPVNTTAALSCSTGVKVPPPDAADTFSEALTECTSPPLEALVVSVNPPVCAAAPAVTVKVDEPDPVMLDGLKLPLVPEPNPVALR